MTNTGGDAQELVRYIHDGLNYHAFLRQFAERAKVSSYFEIGVNKGKSIRLINAPSVGVDPAFIIEGDVVGKKPELHLYQKTSDDFFRDVGLSRHFPNGVDMAFLDGMHLFEFLLRDFINTEKAMAQGGVIFMHDCLPINAEMAERERRPGKRRDVELKSYWTGDVWKVVDILKTHRPDLRVQLLDCAPTGLIAVSNFDARSTALQDAYDGAVERFLGVETDDDTLSAFYARHELTSAATFLTGRFGS